MSIGIRSDKMIFETVHCTGCKTCEIACSYHHRGVFSPSISSIEIQSIPEDLAFKIRFYEKGDNGHLGCDQCQGLEEPFCVKYCNIVARDELKAFLKRLADK